MEVDGVKGRQTVSVRSRKCRRCNDETTTERKIGFHKAEEERISSNCDADSSLSSREAHQHAKQRTPPVDIGDEIKAGIEDFSRHHSGRQDAIIRKEGFVIFVKDIPGENSVGDVVCAKITSFNLGGSSANAVLSNLGP